MLDKNNIPKHVAIIMDGNGRWAKAHGLPRAAGHREGIKRVDEIIEAAGKLGIAVLTLFAFSTENWQRPKKEVAMLLGRLDDFLSRRIGELEKNNIRLRFIGRSDPIPQALQKKLKQAEDKTAGNSGLTVVLALNYGSRQEITDAARRVSCAVRDGLMDPESIDEESFGRYLYTAGLPEPDLLIRTSAEMRLSNFLLWQLSYAELYFPQIYWPDFRSGDLEEAIRVYQKRNRRFGRVDAWQKDN